jgi:hypothetical protein
MIAKIDLSSATDRETVLLTSCTVRSLSSAGAGLASPAGAQTPAKLDRSPMLINIRAVDLPSALKPRPTKAYYGANSGATGARSCAGRSKPRPYDRETPDAAMKDHLSLAPAGASSVNVASTGLPSGPTEAATIMPLDSTPRSLRGARFTTTTTFLPTSSSGV